VTRFLIHGNAPHVKTGYGVQIAQLAERLAPEHEVAVSCTYGQQGATGTWVSPSTGQPVRLYPAGYEVNGNDVIHNHALHFFDTDPLNGWLITLLDVWCLQNPRLADFNIAAWCPVDHFPAPPDVLKFFHRTGAVPVAMSRFGERLLFAAGLNPVYIPLSVDTKVMKPTPTLEVDGKRVTARELLGIPHDAFCVGMVAMNKGWARDRKGFNEALRAFGAFHRAHPNAVLYLHADKYGAAEGINLVELADHAGVPQHAIAWVDQYAYRLGLPAEMMAATYTAMDVLLAPSHGEGFCVPLIEAQACGTPVIASDFSAQSELVGAGWLVDGQPEWDPAQHASYIVPFIDHIVARLEQAYTSDLAGMQANAVAFASRYDADRVFVEHWQPFLATLTTNPEPVELDRAPIPTGDNAVAVVVPVMNRPDNVRPLVESLIATTKEANVYFICDPDDQAEIDAVTAMVKSTKAVHLILSQRGHTYAVKTNVAYEHTDEPWLFVCGDDVRFHDGWIEEARKLSDRFDLIGTNDTTGPVKNPDVADGSHADHWFVRRSYVDTYGASLDGPGTVTPECYEHWWVDREVVGLAKARNVFTPCLASVVEHLHPGYDGKPRDATYMKAMDAAEVDQKTFESRRPLIEMQRTSRGKIR
jgi:glycosyltransferase involved in cell wall biosynthesis